MPAAAAAARQAAWLKSQGSGGRGGGDALGDALGYAVGYAVAASWQMNWAVSPQSLSLHSPPPFELRTIAQSSLPSLFGSPAFQNVNPTDCTGRTQRQQASGRRGVDSSSCIVPAH